MKSEELEMKEPSICHSQLDAIDMLNNQKNRIVRDLCWGIIVGTVLCSMGCATMSPP